MLRWIFPVLLLIGGATYAVDYLNGGIERITTQEAMSCLRQAGATEVRIEEAGVVATTKGRTADVVVGDVEQGDYMVPITVAVLEDDNLPSGDYSSDGFADEEITNAIISWDAKATRPSPVLTCLESERLD
jgi:hypothetical protein